MPPHHVEFTTLVIDLLFFTFLKPAQTFSKTGPGRQYAE